MQPAIHGENIVNDKCELLIRSPNSAWCFLPLPRGEGTQGLSGCALFSVLLSMVIWKPIPPDARHIPCRDTQNSHED